MSSRRGLAVGPLRSSLRTSPRPWAPVASPDHRSHARDRRLDSLGSACKPRENSIDWYVKDAVKDIENLRASWRSAGSRSAPTSGGTPGAVWWQGVCSEGRSRCPVLFPCPRSVSFRDRGEFAWRWFWEFPWSSPGRASGTSRHKVRSARRAWRACQWGRPSGDQMLSAHHWEIGKCRRCRRYPDRPRGALAGWASGMYAGRRGVLGEVASLRILT